MSKKALGRGIEALLKTAGEDRNVSAVNEVSPDSLSVNPYQPRQDFNEDNLNELADSIRQKGILQPVLVESAGEGKYIIIAGERRVRAAKIAGLKQIPVIVKQFSDEDKLEIALIENIQRENLSPVEEAYAYKKLIDISGLNQEEIARKVGRKRSTIANALRLLKLPESIQDALGKGRITSGHARALLMIEDKEQQKNLFQRILKHRLSVRQAEAFASEKKGNNKTEKRNISPELKEIEQRLMNVLGTKIVIKGNDSRGRIEISYFSLDDLNRVIDIIT